MADSMQIISHADLLLLMNEQQRQVKAGGKKPSFKQLISDAVQKEYSDES